MSGVRMLSDKQKKRYVEDTPCCPWCGSSELDPGPLSTHDSAVLRCRVDCVDCGANWNEVYARVTIEDGCLLRLYTGDEVEDADSATDSGRRT